MLNKLIKELYQDKITINQDNFFFKCLRDKFWDVMYSMATELTILYSIFEKLSDYESRI